jgi:hypothetical protein
LKKKKRGVGSTHRKRVARKGWRLSGPIPSKGRGVPVLEHHLDGVMVLRGRGVLRRPEVGAERKWGRGSDGAPFIGDTAGSGGWVAGDATRRQGMG